MVTQLPSIPLKDVSDTLFGNPNLLHFCVDIFQYANPFARWSINEASLILLKLPPTYSLLLYLSLLSKTIVTQLLSNPFDVVNGNPNGFHRNVSVFQDVIYFEVIDTLLVSFAVVKLPPTYKVFVL